MSLTTLPVYLAQTTLAVSFLIAIILIIRAPFAKAFGAKAAYVLWAIPLLRLALPPLPESWTLIGWLTRPAPEPQSFILPDAGTVLTPHLTSLSEDTASIDIPAQASFWSLAVENVALISPFLAALWLAGFCAFITLTFVRQHRSDTQSRDASIDLPAPTHTLAVTLKTHLNLTDIKIRTCPDTDGPCVQGLLKPSIWLPETFTIDYTPTQQRLALLHEMMHIKRRDLWALHLATLALAVQWFNPLAWLAMRTFRIDQEAACDADVLQEANVNPYTYGETLVKAARAFRHTAFQHQATSLSLNHALHERLNIMKTPNPSKRKRFTGSVITASFGAAAILASACAASNAQTASPDEANVDVRTKVKVESILISDEGDETRSVRIIQNGEELDLSNLDTEGKTSIKIFAADGEGDLSDIDNLFIMKADSARPDTKAFAAKIGELTKDPVKNQAEIQALTADFEAKMEAWAEQNASAQTGTLHFEMSDSNWTESDIGCENGSSVRTVVIKKDETTNHEEKTVNVNCGTEIDTASLIADLRTRGDLSDAQIAEIESKLEDTLEKLDITKKELGEMNFTFEPSTNENKE